MVMEGKNVLEEGRTQEVERPKDSGEASGSREARDVPRVRVRGAKWRRQGSGPCERGGGLI